MNADAENDMAVRDSRQAEDTGDGLSFLIGERVRALRERAGLSQITTAERTSGAVDQGTLSALERGKRAWRAPHLEAVARALGVTPRDLLPAAEGEASLSIEERELLDAVRARDLARALKALTKAIERPHEAEGDEQT